MRGTEHIFGETIPQVHRREIAEGECDNELKRFMKKYSVSTCILLASLRNPEIISWRTIFKHKNHLSQVRKSSS